MDSVILLSREVAGDRMTYDYILIILVTRSYKH